MTLAFWQYGINDPNVIKELIENGSQWKTTKHSANSQLKRSMK